MSRLLLDSINFYLDSLPPLMMEILRDSYVLLILKSIWMNLFFIGRNIILPIDFGDKEIH